MGFGGIGFSFVTGLSSLVYMRVLKILVCNFQPSLLGKIQSSFGNRMLRWEVSGNHNRVTSLSFNKKILS